MMISLLAVAAALLAAAPVIPPKDKSPQALKAAESAVGEYREAVEQDGELILDGTLIVSRYEPGTVYFKVERQSYENGRHRCELAGVARYEKGRFVYSDGKRCRLELRLAAGAATLSDGGSCLDHCGVAMTLDGMKARR